MENSNIASRLQPLVPLDGTNNAANGSVVVTVTSEQSSLEQPCEQQSGVVHQQSLSTAVAGPSPVDPNRMNSSSGLANRQCLPAGSSHSSVAVPCSVDVVQQPSQPHQQQQHHQLVDASIAGSYGMAVSGGRVSPPCYPGGTYATLTPLQPLPPISTVSEKFNSGGNGNNMGFVFMQHHGAHDLASFGRGPEVYPAYKYDKDVGNGDMTVAERTVNCNGFESSDNSLVTVMNGIGTGYAMSQQQQQLVRNLQSQYAMYGHSDDVRPVQVKNDLASSTAATIDRMSPYDNVASIYTSNLMSASQMPVKSASSAAVSMGVNSMNIQNGSLASSLLAPRGTIPGVDIRQQQQQQQQLRVGSPDQPSSSTDTHGCDDSSSPTEGSGSEEINTRDVALRVSNELKKYSIPQAVFAQRVLGRSQGTLSDLLRNPKPWSKLKSGRETFRRMWKWLQEPEYQRMAALRIPGPGSYNTPDSANGTMVKQASIACKRSRDGTLLNTPQPIAPQQHRPTDGGGQQAASCPATAAAKKPRMVFTEIQRRTLVAIFKEIKRPSKEIQATIAEQLGLKVSTVVNFFMNARRRSVDKYMDETPSSSSTSAGDAVNSAAVSSTAGPSDDAVRQ